MNRSIPIRLLLVSGCWLLGAGVGRSLVAEVRITPRNEANPKKAAPGQPPRPIQLEPPLPLASARSTQVEQTDPLQQLTHASVEIRRKAADALSQTPRVADLPALISALKDPDPTVAGSVANGLRMLGPLAAPAVPALIKAVAHPKANVRQLAAHALGAIGDPAAIPALGALTQDDVPGLRQSAWAALALLKAPAALSWLTAGAKDPDEVSRRYAVQGLGALGPAAAPALTQALKDPQPTVRLKAAEGLAAFDDPRVPALILEAFEPLAAESLTEMGLAKILGSLGPRILPDLLLALKRPELSLRRGATRTVYYMDDPRALLVLSLALHDPQEGVRFHAIHSALPFGVQALPILVRGMADPSKTVRRRAAEQLSGLGEDGVSGLLLGFGDPDKEVWQTAERGAISMRYSQVCDTLLEMAGHSADSVRAGALRGLVALQCPGAYAKLQRALEDAVPIVRLQAVTGIGRLGWREATALLTPLANDPDPRVRQAVKAALDQLGLADMGDFQDREHD